MVGVVASVIIPTYEDWRGLRICLDALAAQDFPAEAFEILICNNNATNDLPADLPLPANARVIWEPKAGSYAARNAGLAEARGEVLFFTDADCAPVPDWMSRALARLEAEPALDRIAGHIEVIPTSGRWNGWSVFDRTFRLRQDHYARQGKAVTANLVTRRRVFDAIGPFAEAHFSGGDMEWNTRATKAGFNIAYDPQVALTHPARDSFAENFTKTRRIAGADYAKHAKTVIRKRLPRIEYIIPSPGALRRLWAGRHIYGTGMVFAGWACHYALRWVYNAEIIRLGFFGGKAGRR